MEQSEMFERIRKTMEAKELNHQDIAKELRMTDANFVNIIKKGSCMLYIFLDIIYEIGLELVLNGKPMTCHQDVVEYIQNYNKNYYAASMAMISRKTGITPLAVKRFMEGENVQLEKALKIINMLGIDAKII